MPSEKNKDTETLEKRPEDKKTSSVRKEIDYALCRKNRSARK